MRFLFDSFLTISVTEAAFVLMLSAISLVKTAFKPPSDSLYMAFK
jgi:hypothetical protein